MPQQKPKFEITDAPQGQDQFEITDPNLRTGEGMEFPAGGRPEPIMRESALGKVRASYVEHPFAELEGAAMVAPFLIPEIPGASAALGRIGGFVAPRVLGAAGGAWLGGSAAREFGVHPAYGAVPGAVAGALLPGAGRYSRLGRLGSILGNIGREGEEATGIEGGTLAERIRAEQEAARLVRTPQEFRDLEQAGKAHRVAKELARPLAEKEGMIHAGRGPRPQLSNEELRFLRRRR